MNILIMRQSDIAKCPFYILVPEHYREDKTCKCNDAEERAKMIREWGYSPEDFKDIPLREDISGHEWYCGTMFENSPKHFANRRLT